MRKVILSILACLSLTASAQTLYDHTPNARAAAMGGATLATSADAFSVFGNAAAVPMEYKRIQAAFSYVNFSGDLYRQNRMLSGGAYVRFAQRHALMAGVEFNIEPSIGETRPGLQTYNLGYGYKLSERVSLAATARFRRTYNYPIAAENFSGGGADLSVFSHLPLQFLEGATLNIGGKISFDTPALPLYDCHTFTPAAGVGLSMPFSDSHMFNITAQAEYGVSKNDKILVAKVGAEYSLMRLFYIRAGGNFSRIDAAQPININYGTIGGGVRFFHLQFDIAYLVGKKDTPFHNAVQINFGVDF